MNDLFAPDSDAHGSEPLDEGGTWLLDLVSAVDHLRRGYRPGFTVWDALAEAIDWSVPKDKRPWHTRAALYGHYVEWAKAQRQAVLSADKWGTIFTRKHYERQCRGGRSGYLLSLSASAAQILVDEGKGRG